jgi:hypothetical protein
MNQQSNLSQLIETLIVQPIFKEECQKEIQHFKNDINKL